MILFSVPSYSICKFTTFFNALPNRYEPRTCRNYKRPRCHGFYWLTPFLFSLHVDKHQYSFILEGTKVKSLNPNIYGNFVLDIYDSYYRVFVGQTLAKDTRSVRHKKAQLSPQALIENYPHNSRYSTPRPTWVNSPRTTPMRVSPERFRCSVETTLELWHCTTLLWKWLMSRSSRRPAGEVTVSMVETVEPTLRRTRYLHAHNDRHETNWQDMD